MIVGSPSGSKLIKNKDMELVCLRAHIYSYYTVVSEFLFRFTNWLRINLLFSMLETKKLSIDVKEGSTRNGRLPYKEDREVLLLHCSDSIIGIIIPFLFGSNLEKLEKQAGICEIFILLTSSSLLGGIIIRLRY